MTNKQKKLILGTSIVFILLRLVFAYIFKDSFFERGNRHTSINQIAMNLLENGTFGLSVGNPSAANEPIYTSFIAFSYWLFGTNWFGPAFLQSLILGFNAFLIYLLTFELWANKRLSFLALVAVNLYPFYFTQSISVSDTVFYTGLLALSMYLSKKSMESKKIFFWVITGVVWGLLLLTRFSGISIFGMVLLFQFLYHGWNYLPRLLIIGVTTLITLLPWFYRNYTHTEAFFLSSHGSIEIWMGHNSMSKDVIENDISVDILRNEKELVPGLESLSFEDFPNDISYEYAEGKLYLAAAMDYLKNHPISLIKMAPLKFVKFWSIFKNPKSNSRDDTKSGKGMSWYWDTLYTLYFTPLLILFLFGLTSLIVRSNRPKLNDTFLVILAAFTGYSILHTFVFGFTRLRVPLDQFMIVIALYGVNQFSLFKFSSNLQFNK